MQDRVEGGDIDQVLALVVGGAATVKALALFDDCERVQTRAPLIGLGPDHIAMAIAQHGGQVVALMPLGNQKWAGIGNGVGIGLAGKSHGPQAGQHGLLQIAGQFGGLIGILAFGFKADQISKF